jgi:hypothetical protein
VAHLPVVFFATVFLVVLAGFFAAGIISSSFLD